MFRFIQITENIKLIFNEFKLENSDIQWGDIIGSKNSIVHDYGKVDLKIVYDTTKNDLEGLSQLFGNLLKD